MKTKKVLFTLLVAFLILTLTITGCTPSKRPTPPKQGATRENVGTTQPGVRNNAMPNTPMPATPAKSDKIAFQQLNEFDLEVKLINRDEIKMEYKKGAGAHENKIENRINGKNERIVSNEASRQIEDLVSKIPVTSLADASKIIDGTLSALNIKREDVVKFDMDFKFVSGEKVKIEFDRR